MRGVVNVLGAWLKILLARFACNRPSTSLLQILDMPLTGAIEWYLNNGTAGLTTVSLQLLASTSDPAQVSSDSRRGSQISQASQYVVKATISLVLQPMKCALCCAIM